MINNFEFFGSPLQGNKITLLCYYSKYCSTFESKIIYLPFLHPILDTSLINLPYYKSSS
jgi:hypothetical protein